MRYPLEHTQKDVKLPKERMVPNKPSSLQSFMMAQVPKETICIPPTHTWKGSQGECSKKNRIAPPSIVQYGEFAFEYKMHKVGSPLSLYLENTRQGQEINKIHKWYGIQWELTQS